MSSSKGFRLLVSIGIGAALGGALWAFGSSSASAAAAAAATSMSSTQDQQMSGKQLVGRGSNLLSPGILVGNTLYLSGQLGTQGRAEGISGETRAAITNAQNILKMAQMDLPDVVSVTAYLVESADYQAFNKVYTEMFSAMPKPTRTTVIVKELVNSAKVELTMTAAKAR